jgi:3-oxoadipate enol-lactonase
MESTVEVNGIHLNYYDSAPGDDELQPVVFLHGLGGCWQAWQFQEPALANHGGYRIIAVDQRGHGKTSKPHTPYSVALLALDVVELLKSLALKPVYLVGHSLGGMVSYHLAATRPELAARLVIINSFARIPSVKPKSIFKLFYRTSIIYGLGLQAWARALSWEILPRQDQADLRRRLMALSASMDDRAAYIETMKAAVKADLRPLLPRIKGPVLLLAADKDYTPTAAKLEDAELINSLRYGTEQELARVVEIPNSRHLSPWDQADRVNAELLAFFS